MKFSASPAERLWPDDLCYLWDRSLSAQELGGLIATRGFYYQYIYALRLMPQIWKGDWTAYACEVPDDFMAWLCDPSGRVTRLAFIQVKTATDACFLSGTAEKHRKVFQSWKRAAALTGPLPGVSAVEFRLVCNKHAKCTDACDAAFLIRHKLALSRFKKDMQTFFPGASIAVGTEHFLPVPASHSDFLHELSFLNEIGPRLFDFLASSANLSHVVRHIVGAILPYHTSRTGGSLREAIQRSRSVMPLLLQHDRTAAAAELREALTSAARRALSRRSDPAMLERQARAKQRASQELLSARATRDLPKGEPAVVFSSRQEALSALEAIYRLGDDTTACLFRPGAFRLWIHAEAFWLTPVEPRFERRPLHALLAKSRLTHLQRIGLIVSYARVIGELARAGIVFSATRIHRS